MAEPIKAKSESYAECPTCSTAEGERVVYFRKQLVYKEPGLLSFLTDEKPHWECPLGHPVDFPLPVST